MKRSMFRGVIALLFLTINIYFVNSQEVSTESEKIIGEWMGTLEAGANKLRIVFKVIKNENSLVATMDSPDQGAIGIQVSNVFFGDDTVKLEVKIIGGIYKGGINEAGDKIEGTWSQGPYSFPLNLDRVEKAPEVFRPQEPKPPFPYIEEEVFIENPEAGIKLSGTITMPRDIEKAPVVILISGSGAQDRNEEIFSHKPFLVIADYLTRRGIAVLRYDERGVGKSTGDFSVATTEDFASDVMFAVAFLKEHDKIDPEQIGLIGHSEGGMIAPMVASRSDDISFIVMLAGPGITGEKILYLQGRKISEAAGLAESEIKTAQKLNKKIYNIAKKEPDNQKAFELIKYLFSDITADMTEEEIEKAGFTDEGLEAIIRPVLSPWFRNFLVFNPRDYLKKVRCPVLSIIGGNDLQVPAKENNKAIKIALKSAKNNDFTVRELPDLNHLFQTSESGSPSEYGKIEETFSPSALELIGNWILAKTK